MSEWDEVKTIVSRHWRVLLKWVLRIHDYPEITVDELYSKLDSDNPPFMIDTRSPEDYFGTGYSTYDHIPDAMNIPMLELEGKLDELTLYRDMGVVTMCPGGGLSLAAVDIMRDEGFRDVKSLKGGTDAWNRRGYPLVK